MELGAAAGGFTAALLEAGDCLVYDHGRGPRPTTGRASPGSPSSEPGTQQLEVHEGACPSAWGKKEKVRALRLRASDDDSCSARPTGSPRSLAWMIARLTTRARAAPFGPPSTRLSIVQRPGPSDVDWRWRRVRSTRCAFSGPLGRQLGATLRCPPDAKPGGPISVGWTGHLGRACQVHRGLLPDAGSVALGSADCGTRPLSTRPGNSDPILVI
jgi:hypothetical protein